MTSRILFLPLRSVEHGDPSPQTRALEAVLHSSGHRAEFSEREQVSEELLEGNDAVFLEVLRDDDLAYAMRLRSRSLKPMLIYGAGVPRSLQIESLSIGADAFLGLPDSPDILRARVNAFLRRSGLEPSKKGDVEINKAGLTW